MRDHNWTRRGFLALSAAAGLLPHRVLAGTEVEYSNAHLVMPDGSTQVGGLRFRDGLIDAIGTSVTGGTDLKGKWLVPGFTDAGCRLGLLEVGMEKDTHDTSAKKSQALDARAVDGYNPRSELIPVARVNGITQILLNPQMSGMIPGQAALMRTTGDRLSDVTLAAPVGLCMNLGRAGQGHDGPESRIALMMEWRKFFEEHPKSGGSKKSKKGDKSDKNEESIVASLRSGELLALVRANRADDIERALELIAENELNAALVGCIEGHLVADSIASAGVPVLLGPLDAQPNSFQHPHARYENPAILHEAGVLLAFRSGDAHQVRNLPTLAGLAVAHGLPWDAAIRALTVNPMDIFGQPNLGRLAVGAEATFFIVDGDPLQPRHAVREVFVRGGRTSMETRQTRLYDAFKELE
jgi:imidazolonepropionase-like amidohydrolase